MTQLTIFETRKPTQAERILARLEAAGPTGLTNIQLNETCFRYSARILDLRKQGYKIAIVNVKGPVFRYILHPGKAAA